MEIVLMILMVLPVNVCKDGLGDCVKRISTNVKITHANMAQHVKIKLLIIAACAEMVSLALIARQTLMTVTILVKMEVTANCE